MGFTRKTPHTFPDNISQQTLQPVQQPPLQPDHLLLSFPSQEVPACPTGVGVYPRSLAETRPAAEAAEAGLVGSEICLSRNEGC